MVYEKGTVQPVAHSPYQLRYTISQNYFTNTSLFLCTDKQIIKKQIKITSNTIQETYNNEIHKKY